MNQPNILLVLTDDQGYGDLGCTGNPWLHTPNLDRFHGESVRLTNYHVGPTCAPTRAGLLTGHYANSTGVWHTIGGRSLLRQGERTLAEYLGDAGYATGIFGKWHLGDAYPYRPQDRGFQRTVVHGGGGIGQTPDHWGNDYFDDTYQVDGVPTPCKGYCTDVFFREAMHFVEENRDRPFFCYLATNAPHSPYNVEARYAEPYRGRVMENRARFYGMISNIDENFGRLRERLAELDLQRNTILMFMTDNGSSEALTFDQDGNPLEGYNAGLRGQKCSEYDGGHRTPFFLRWPEGGIGGGKDIGELAANVDFLPTMLDLCGAPYKSEDFHGVTLKPLLTGEAESLPPRMVVTDSQRVPQPIKWRKSSVMTGEWRLVNGGELYNLEEDRAQERNIAADHPRLVEALREGYEEWWALVSRRFDEPVSLHLTGPTRLTTHDWRGDENNCAWNQGQIREGPHFQGYWEVYAPQGGRFEIALYRWPPEAGHTLREGAGGDVAFEKDGIQPEYKHYYAGGRALPISGARLLLDGEVLAGCELEHPAQSAGFAVEISGGNHRLEGRFVLDSGEEIGSYYAVVQPVL